MAEANEEPIPGYRLIDKLGSGGFGEVWRAEAPGGLLKAVKIVFGRLGGEGDSQAQRELKGLTRVKDVRHPFVLSVERFELVDGKLVIVMELADMDLADRLGQCQAQGLPGIPRDELLKYLTEAAEALDLMNSKYEVQHLDIKPSNIFVVGGHVKVADFGLAKDLEGMRATVTGGMTPVYAAPETFNGWAARQTDQYSLAIVFQELLTGTRPFIGPAPPQYMLQHLTKEPDLNAFSFADRRIVRKALAKDPKERFETCSAFIEALKKVDQALEKSDDALIEPRRRPATTNSMAISRLTPISRQAPSPVKPMTPIASVPKPPSNVSRPLPTRGDDKPPSVGRWAGAIVEEPIIGIDLGTTNSVVAILEGREPKVLANQEGARLTPSVVAITDKGERLVGQSARSQATVNPRRTISSVKRFIGRRRHECDADEGIVSYELAGDAEKPVQIKIDDKLYTPQEVSAAVLAKLKGAAEEYLGREVRRAVVTVPAYFNESQRQATKDAGEIAGLVVERIVNEPTAAALAYGLERGEQQRIVVFDLGGGTFDVTILRIRDGIFDVLSTCGDTRLGGDDFDAAIVAHLSEQFKQEHGIDPRSDPLARQRLKEAAEVAKKELSNQSVTHVNLPFLLADANGPKHLSASVTRLAFEKMTQDLIDRCKPPMLQALSDARMTPPDVDEVVLVGGSSRMPHVRKMVRDFFGKEPCKGVNPDEAIALGAAIQGGILDGRFADLLLLDVTPLSLGLETAGGVMTVLVERNTTVPTVKREIFTTARPDQREVGIHVLQGERSFARDNRSLGKFWLENLGPVNNAAPQVEVTFTLDANGILNVAAKDVLGGQSRTVRIESSSGLSQEEIQRMRADAENFASLDKAKHEMLQAAAEAHQSCVEAERALYEHPKMPEAERKAIQAAIVEVRVQMEAADAAKLHLAVWQLEQAMRSILEPAH